jgi:hypothetical protein
MHTIWINGHAFEIRSNLHDFLGLLQTREPCWIWIDQLCIDQSSLTERNEQVGMMHEIYTGAQQTLVWLGLDPVDGARAVDVLEGLCSHGPLLEDDKRVLKAFCHLPYWSRHWVAQEIYLSGNALLLYDRREMAMAFLKETVFQQPAHLILFVGITPFYTMMTFICAPKHLPGYFWEQAMMLACKSECQDERDKIFGIQSVLNEQLRLQVDYSLSNRDVLLRAVKLWHGLVDTNDFVFHVYMLAVGMQLVDWELYKAPLACRGGATVESLKDRQDLAMEDIVSIFTEVIDKHQQNMNVKETTDSATPRSEPRTTQSILLSIQSTRGFFAQAWTGKQD